MDAALSFRAMHPQTPAQPRAEAVPVRASVPTLLPQDQSVPAAEESAQNGAAFLPRAKGDLPRLSDEVLRELEREVEINEDTGDVVSRTFDMKTGQVLTQYPAEPMLKLRAYVQTTSDDAGSVLTRTT